MNFSGEIRNISQDWTSGEIQITLSVRERTALIEADSLKGSVLDIDIKKHRNKRSINANALLWVCLGRIAEKLQTDKWEVYLRMLKRYGQFTYICVKPNVVEAVKSQWRECEELGTLEINGQKAVQMLCYFGSHTYNVQEFSRLLDGVVDEMKEIGLQPPTSEEMKRSLALWEKYTQ